MNEINAKLFNRSKSVVPGGVHSPVRSFKGLHQGPIFVKEARGAKFTDESGKDYIDFCMSFGPLILGHTPPSVMEEIQGALTRGWTYGAAERYSLELAEYLVDRIDHIDQVRFVNSGTEAVMTAIRIARGYTGKNKIIKFDGCYHGHSDSMLIKSGSGLAGEGTNSSEGLSPETAKSTLVFKLGDIEGLKERLAADADIAAIFIEPLPANNGLLPQEKSFLQELRALCDKHNVLLVFDEVISGFRVHFQGMAHLVGVTPDLVTYGKIIGGGFPVGAVAGKKDIMQKLAPVGDVYQAGTLSANPVAMVAGLATLKELSDSVYELLDETTTKVTSLLKDYYKRSGYQSFITKESSLFWTHPEENNLTSPDQLDHKKLQESFGVVFKDLLERGIYLAPNAYEVGFVSVAHQRSLKELEERLL